VRIDTPFPGGGSHEQTDAVNLGVCRRRASSRRVRGPLRPSRWSSWGRERRSRSAASSAQLSSMTAGDSPRSGKGKTRSFQLRTRSGWTSPSAMVISGTHACGFDFVAQPVLGKWAPKATVEVDFFRGVQRHAAFGDEQPQLRGRIVLRRSEQRPHHRAYRTGLVAALRGTPVSLTHIAFPLGYGASGKIGWRFPGVFPLPGPERRGRAAHCAAPARGDEGLRTDRCW